jgi:hypothetical protein
MPENGYVTSGIPVVIIFWLGKINVNINFKYSEYFRVYWLRL